MSTEEEKNDFVPDGEKTKISLKTAEGEVFVIDENVAMEFHTFKAFFQDAAFCANWWCLSLNFNRAELVKIIHFCTKMLELKRKANHQEKAKKELCLRRMADS